MINFLIIVFIITLLYLAKNEVILQYIFILSVQGFLLAGIALIELNEIDWPHLLLILFETLFFKALFVPIFLTRLASRSNFKRSQKGSLPISGSTLIATVIITASYTLAHTMHDEYVETRYFTAAISSMAIGFYIAINHKDIFTHLISFIILENGIFLLSLALGSEMPMFVTSAILLDIFSTILIMGIFFKKVQEHFSDSSADKLTRLKD